MTLDTMQDLLLAQLKDIYSAETQITRALPKLAKVAANESLSEAFRTHLAETEGQIERLDEIFAALHASSRGKKCKGMEGLLAEGAETMEEEGDDAVIDAALIADAQRVEHYEIAAYGSAKALAVLLGHDRIVTLLDENLREEVAADEKLSHIAEREVNPQAAGAEIAPGSDD